MMHSTTAENSPARRLLYKAGAVAFWVLIWQLIYSLVAQDFLVASPGTVASRLWVLVGEGAFWLSVAGTGLRVLAGFFSALLAGIVLAVLTNRFSLLYYLFEPLLGIIKSTPVASFIILVLIWMSRGHIPAFVGFLMVTPMVWANLMAGLRAVDTQLLEMAQIYRFSMRKKLRLIYIPALTPNFSAACTTGLGFAWKSAIAAEVISHPEMAIGTKIYDARIYLNTEDLFAWTLTVILLSILQEMAMVRLLALLNRRVLRLSGYGGKRGENRNAR